MTTYQHSCKVSDGGCGRTYSSLEPDAYFCKDCIESRKKLYESIDRRPRVNKTPVKSDYELYMEKSKTVTQKLPDGTEVITTRMRV